MAPARRRIRLRARNMAVRSARGAPTGTDGFPLSTGLILPCPVGCPSWGRASHHGVSVVNRSVVVARSAAERHRAPGAGVLGAGVVIDGRSEASVSESPSSGDPSRPVKLVVWDLDDTLWEGTLSEGPVVLDRGTADVVRALNRRGIVTPVCSSNDRADARAVLEGAGLWAEVVLARVDWAPRGAGGAQG